MSHPERRGGEFIIPEWAQMRSAQVCNVLSIPYHRLERWTEFGLVEVESFRQKTDLPFKGSGSFRVYHYHHVLELGLVREIHKHQKSLERIIELLAPPEGSQSWGSLIGQYDPSQSRETFCAAYTEDEPLDLIVDTEEFLGHVASTTSGTYVNLAQLKSEIDTGIRRVLSTGD